MYTLQGPEATSGEVFALIHNAYDDSIPPLGRQERGPLYLIRGRFDPAGDQPVRFGDPEPFLMLKEGNACYSSYTEAEGETVLWFGVHKYRLVGLGGHSGRVL